MSRPDGRVRTPDGELVDEPEHDDAVPSQRPQAPVSRPRRHEPPPDDERGHVRAPGDFRRMVERHRERARRERTGDDAMPRPR